MPTPDQIRESITSSKATPSHSFAEFNGWFDKKAAEKAAEMKPGQDDGKAEGEKGMAVAATAHANLLQAAQAVARKLSTNGAVTIDDVVHEMRRLGYKESDIEAGDKKAKNWKGSVFADADWVCIGSIASREKSAHGRHVRQWVTRGWLKLHPVNGSENTEAAFHLFKLYNEASHYYPAGTELCFVLGKDMLDSSFSSLSIGGTGTYMPDGTVVRSDVAKLYGCAVFSMDGVGAICVPRRCLETGLRQVSIVNGSTPI